MKVPKVIKRLKPTPSHPRADKLTIRRLAIDVVNTTPIKDSAQRQIRRKGSAPICFKFLVNAYHKYGLKHVLLILVLVMYTCVGAFLFLIIEEPNEISEAGVWKENVEQNRIKLVDRLMRQLFNNSWHLTYINSRVSTSMGNVIFSQVKEYETTVGLKQSERPRLHWDYSSALLYAMTIYTTIGYGHIYPTTHAGRILTMLYAFFGIPLVLTILNDLGKMLTVGMKYPWFQTKRAIRRIARLCTKKPIEDIIKLETEERMNLYIFDLPVLLAISLVVGWIFVCSATFCIWETNWDYLKAFYFFFISLSTVGLGDVLPEHPRYLIMGFGFIIVGLSLVSMCINVIQSYFEKTYQAGNEDAMLQPGNLAQLNRHVSIKKRPGLSTFSSISGAQEELFDIVTTQMSSGSANQKLQRNTSRPGAVLGIFSGSSVRRHKVKQAYAIADAAAQTIISLPAFRAAMFVDENGFTRIIHSPSDDNGNYYSNPIHQSALCLSENGHVFNGNNLSVNTATAQLTATLADQIVTPEDVRTWQMLRFGRVMRSSSSSDFCPNAATKNAGIFDENTKASRSKTVLSLFSVPEDREPMSWAQEKYDSFYSDIKMTGNFPNI